MTNVIGDPPSVCGKVTSTKMESTAVAMEIGGAQLPGKEALFVLALKQNK